MLLSIQNLFLINRNLGINQIAVCLKIGRRYFAKRFIYLKNLLYVTLSELTSKQYCNEVFKKANVREFNMDKNYKVPEKVRSEFPQEKYTRKVQSLKCAGLSLGTGYWGSP